MDFLERHKVEIEKAVYFRMADLIRVTGRGLQKDVNDRTKVLLCQLFSPFLADVGRRIEDQAAQAGKRWATP